MLILCHSKIYFFKNSYKEIECIKNKVLSHIIKNSEYFALK